MFKKVLNLYSYHCDYGYASARFLNAVPHRTFKTGWHLLTGMGMQVSFSDKPQFFLGTSTQLSMSWQTSRGTCLHSSATWEKKRKKLNEKTWLLGILQCSIPSVYKFRCCLTASNRRCTTTMSIWRTMHENPATKSKKLLHFTKHKYLAGYHFIDSSICRLDNFDEFWAN